MVIGGMSVKYVWNSCTTAVRDFAELHTRTLRTIGPRNEVYISTNLWHSVCGGALTASSISSWQNNSDSNCYACDQ